jgi:hypothetical protein
LARLPVAIGTLKRRKQAPFAGFVEPVSVPIAVSTERVDGVANSSLLGAEAWDLFARPA